MPKLIVEIEMPTRFYASAADLRKEIEDPTNDWFDENGLLAIDEAFLTKDRKDDSFYVFKLLRIED